MLSLVAWPDVIPFIRYEDALAAIDWLERAFGFQRHAVHEEGGRVVHAELTFGGGMFMIGSTQEGPNMARTPRQLGGETTGGMYVVVDDADAAFERAKAAGAEVLREPTDQDYGSRDFSVRDPEGFVWSLGTYRPE